MNELFKIDKFDGGFTDAFGRGKAPVNTFSDSRNLIPTKRGSLETPHGFSTTGGLAAFPSGIVKSGIDETAFFTISKMVADPFAVSLESPTSYDGRVYFWEDSDGAKHVVLNTWFKGSATPITSPVAYIDEHKHFDSTDVTIAASVSLNVVITNANAVHGLSSAADYYNGWILRIENGSVDHARVVDYQYDEPTDTATIVTNMDVGKTWVSMKVGGTYTLQRWFHGVDDMIPTFDTPPGTTWESNGRIRGCGGASSSQHKFPWISQYINRTWFNGHTSEFSYQGTYVDQMECKNTCANLGPLTVYRSLITDGAITTKFPDDREYGIGYTIEYDGYEESPLGDFSWSGSTGTGNNYAWLRYDIAVDSSSMSKRVTAVNIYVKERISGIESQAYFLRRFNLLDPTTDELSLGWTYDGDTGEFAILGTTDVTRFQYNDFLDAGDTYFQRTGIYEETPGDRHIVSWKYSEVVSGRRFFANFYDPNLSETITDQVRFTPIAPSGASNYDLIPYDRINYEIDVASGNAEVVKGLSEDNGWLIIFKDNSIFSWYIGPDVPTWVQHKVSSGDGLYAPQSIVKLPEGQIGFADVDGFKILKNQQIQNITQLWAESYYNLSDKANIRAWFDKIDRSLRITNGANITGYVYACYPDFGYSWYKLLHPANHYVEFVCTERDGSVLFTNQYATFQGLFKWHKTDYTYGSGNYIVPYLKTNDIVADESALVLVDKFMVVSSKRGVAGTYTNNAYIDGTLVTSGGFTPWGNQSLSYANLMQKLPVDANVRMGRRIQFEWNFVPYIGQYATADKVQLDAVVVYGEAQVPRNQSR